ncbi:MAG: hypothetical protein ABIT01_12780 [Thermoanaerobaculia bacterium]
MESVVAEIRALASEVKEGVSRLRAATPEGGDLIEHLELEHEKLRELSEREFGPISEASFEELRVAREYLLDALFGASRERGALGDDRLFDLVQKVVTLRWIVEKIDRPIQADEPQSTRPARTHKVSGFPEGSKRS